MYIETGESAICRNKKCEDYNSYEFYDFSEIKIDEISGKYYYICNTCKERIYVE